jgi:hypothetical protein
LVYHREMLCTVAGPRVHFGIAAQPGLCSTWTYVLTGLVLVIGLGYHVLV